MNYEAKVADLSSAPEVLVEDFDSGSRRTRKRWTLVAIIVLAALIIGAAVALMGGEEASPFPAPDGEQVPTVTVLAPGQSSVAGSINATGTLAARRELPVGVVGEGGRVVSVLVEPGDWVGAGQVLAVIDRSVQNEQAGSSAASVDVAKADAQLAQSNLDRALQLVDRGFISKADVDRLTATRDAARARVKVAEAQYRELLARNARLNIVAPDAGLVLERNVEPAQVVGSGSGVLFSIARGGQMELRANLSENDLAAVSVGSTATVMPVGSDKSFAGQIWQLAPIIDAQNRQGIARIALPYDKAIRPGGFASAQISRGQIIAPRLPESAIQSDDKGSFVFVVNKDSRVERRAVTTGVVTEEGITITSGLNGSEKVVERAGGFLNVGDKVKAVAANRGNQAPAQ
ncbi:MAG: efflux RND transporter periplasmic adaptor subunit [Porphyrobacter sp.]|nr:efflux RND transporter periplasmic adaptor subunit [Porphyrobacter sp.]